MMQKLLNRFLSVLLLSVAAVKLSVASSGIAVTLVGFTIDTVNVNLGYTLTISAVVKNTDTVQAFAGSLDFGLHNTQQELSATSVFDKPPYSGSQISLNPGEEVPAVFSIEIDHPYFTPGPDVVVVWPISNSPISDSILINLLIQNPNGIDADRKEDFDYIVLGDKIVLRSTSNEINFKQVRIYNILGQQLSALHSDNVTEIPVPNLPKGIYICEMITSDNRTRTVKFYH